MQNYSIAMEWMTRLSNRQPSHSSGMGSRVGIIGCGRWGTNHLRTLNQLKKLGLVSEIHACDLISSKETELSGLVDTFSTSWETMVQTAELDIIAIVTPIGTHYHLAMQVINHCKVLFIEKPITLTELEARTIVSSIEKLGGKLLVGHILRFHDLINRANKLISQGRIGDLHRVDFSRKTTRPAPQDANVFDALAVHGIDTACYCFDETSPTKATIDNLVFDDGKNPTNTRISLEFSGAKEASINVGWNSESEIRELIYSGTRGSIVVTMNDCNYLKLITNEYEQTILVNDIVQPLTREWQYIIKQSIDADKPVIYPPQKSIFRCMRWLDVTRKAMLKQLPIN